MVSSREKGAKRGPPAVKERLKKIVTENPDCAELLGGLPEALELIEKMDLINLSDPADSDRVSAGDALKATLILLNPTKPAWAAADIGGSRVFVDNRFFSELTPRSQDTAFIHELQHNKGVPRSEIDTQEGMKKNLEEIIENCKTGGLPRKSLLPPS